MKLVVLLRGIFQRATKVWGLPANPAAEVEKPPLRRSGDFDVFSPEEVWALVRAAGSAQDAAIYLTATFTVCGWGASGAPVARRRLCRVGDPSPRELHRGGGDDAEVRKGTGGAAGAGR